MQGECLLYPILQKYYNALKNLFEIDTQQDLFENIAKVDAFFSEFRSITLVMQKGFSTPEMKEYYEKLRNKYLSNDLMKWFNDSRVSVVHLSPFNLEKSLIVDVFSPDKKFIAIKDRFTVDNEIPFSSLEMAIKEYLTRFIKLPEIYFTISLIFCEKDKEINMYPKIIAGLQHMNSFIETLITDYPCNCSRCCIIKEKIKEIYSKVFVKQICFIWDCVLTDEKISYGRQEIIVPQGISPNIKDILSEKYSIEKTKIYTDCKDLESLFESIAVFHTFMYIQQNCNIMPTFFLIYDDKTFSTLLFNGSNKTTFYRIISNIAELCSSKNIKAVIYVGEYSYWSIEELEKAKGTLKERKDSVEKSLFCCSLIKKDNTKSILIDKEKIDDKAYIRTQFAKPVDNINWIWFSPIREALNKNGNINE